jgi:hypothetical protein
MDDGTAPAHAPHSQLEYLLALEQDARAAAAAELLLAHVASASSTPAASPAAAAVDSTTASGAGANEADGACCDRSAAAAAAAAQCDPSPRSLVGPSNASSGHPTDANMADSVPFSAVPAGALTA